ncbi:MAG: hypothetical protein KVP17_003296 [Porospora cf. gigantea B]|uniref:uncharacterized protein n=1 Tax=Porospora cf. gigantea B TaxID=2853592 RepID=UPI003571B6A7|nr:MAG: hypothetical protein KVP17_003296 [Porospora cf. gigantea B]
MKVSSSSAVPLFVTQPSTPLTRTQKRASRLSEDGFVGFIMAVGETSSREVLAERRRSSNEIVCDRRRWGRSAVSRALQSRTLQVHYLDAGCPDPRRQYDFEVLEIDNPQDALKHEYEYVDFRAVIDCATAEGRCYVEIIRSPDAAGFVAFATQDQVVCEEVLVRQRDNPHVIFTESCSPVSRARRLHHRPQVRFISLDGYQLPVRLWWAAGSWRSTSENCTALWHLQSLCDSALFCQCADNIQIWCGRSLASVLEMLHRPMDPEPEVEQLILDEVQALLTDRNLN